jgi:hypothetical protein
MTGINDIVGDFISRYGRGAVKGRIRSRISPYIKALQEDGVGREEIESLVRNNISFYQSYLPKAWKKLIVQELAPHVSQVENIDEDTVTLLVEAISEEIPWFAEVVTWERRSWLLKEFELALKDVKASQGR